MSLSVDGVWKVGVWATTVWADGVWQEGAAQVATPSVAGGRKPKRRRYLLPDNTLIWATGDEILEILEQFVEVEQPKPKTRKQKRKAKHEPFVPIAIKFEPLPDFAEPVYRPVLPPLKLADLAKLKRKVELLKRRIDDEEAILLLL